MASVACAIQEDGTWRQKDFFKFYGITWKRYTPKGKHRSAVTREKNYEKEQVKKVSKGDFFRLKWDFVLKYIG